MGLWAQHQWGARQGEHPQPCWSEEGRGLAAPHPGGCLAGSHSTHTPPPHVPGTAPHPPALPPLSWGKGKPSCSTTCLLRGGGGSFRHSLNPKNTGPCSGCSLLAAQPSPRHPPPAPPGCAGDDRSVGEQRPGPVGSRGPAGRGGRPRTRAPSRGRWGKLPWSCSSCCWGGGKGHPHGQHTHEGCG